MLLIVAGLACSSEPGLPHAEGESLGVARQAATGTTVPPSDCSANDESLEDFSAACKQAMDGIEMPSFDCEGPASVEVPDTGSRPGANNAEFCDRPNVLNHECDPGSRFQVAVDQGDVKIVVHCRRKGNPAGTYNDIAMIAYNQRTGDTCFFQNTLTDMSSDMPSPKDGTQGRWKSPAEVQKVNCVRCHDNGPFIRDPYLTQLKGTPNTEQGRPEHDAIVKAQVNAAITGAIVPGSRDTGWNRTQPYRFVGKNFQKWTAYALSVKDGTISNVCTTCHRLGVSSSRTNSWGSPAFNTTDGTGLVLGLTATADLQARKNPHGLGGPVSPRGRESSPIWMYPTTSVYDAQAEAQARVVSTCANAITTGGTLPAGCSYARFAQGADCLGTSIQIETNGATHSVPSKTPQHVTIPLPTGGDIGFITWTSIHGPFVEQSRRIPLGSVGFDGSFIKIGATQVEAGWEGPPSALPRAGAGGRIDIVTFRDIQGIPDITQCGSTVSQIAALSGEFGLLEAPVDDGRMGIDSLSALIGAVASKGAPGMVPFVGLEEHSSSTWLTRRASRLTPYNDYGPFEAEAWSSGCNGWTPIYEATHVESRGDVVIAPPDRASKSRCFITGIGGDWSTTNAGGTVQSYAEIYYAPNGVHLHVQSAGDPAEPGFMPVSAYASCIQLRP